ncbi:hypothetical protein PLICRDRAFT_632692 [Plicaturopsis crispa FD-325 SS-3]|nr:hypothetical protein PLICRDRAFT_632692 [Plicaturopsis crispa FD-325 SS-3]
MPSPSYCKNTPLRVAFDLQDDPRAFLFLKESIVAIIRKHFDFTQKPSAYSKDVWKAFEVEVIRTHGAVVRTPEKISAVLRYASYNIRGNRARITRAANKAAALGSTKTRKRHAGTPLQATRKTAAVSKAAKMKKRGNAENVAPLPALPRLRTRDKKNTQVVEPPAVIRPRPQPSPDYIVEFLSKTQPALTHLLPLFLESGVRTKPQVLGMADWVDDWTRHRMLDGRLTMLEGFVMNEEVMDLKELA